MSAFDPGPGRPRPGTFTIISGFGTSDPVTYDAGLDDVQQAFDQAQSRNLSAEEIDEMFIASQRRSEMRRDLPGRWWPIAVLIVLVLFAAYLIGSSGGI